LGNLWQADQYFKGGAVSSGPVPAGAPGYFSTKRYGDFTYTLPVPDGAYTVGLSFLENVQLAAGARVFNVTINGAPVLTSYDIVADVGLNAPVRKTFQTTAAGKGIAIKFSTLARSALVNAIDVTTVPSLQLGSVQVCSGSGLSPADPSETVWDPLATYPAGTAISWNSFSWVSLQAMNTGNQPDTSATWWKGLTWDCGGLYAVSITLANGSVLSILGAAMPVPPPGPGVTWSPVQ
jgi:hypothetical protein